jgi:hypothetical protein
MFNSPWLYNSSPPCIVLEMFQMSSCIIMSYYVGSEKNNDTIRSEIGPSMWDGAILADEGNHLLYGTPSACGIISCRRCAETTAMGSGTVARI